MKRFVQLLVMLMLLLTVGLQSVTAQNKFAGNNPQKRNQPIRCATEELLAERYRTDPEYRAAMDKQEADYQAWKAAHQDDLNNITAHTNLLTAPVVIPVVMHIVMDNPYSVTDANCQYVINRLNSDFSGFNPDSTNAPLFYSRRGHSLIRFCLAKRTPAGLGTNGIERRVSNTQSNTSQTNDPIKSTAQGGLDSWDNTRYYNIWVGRFTNPNLLGYSNSIGPGSTSQDGYVTNFQVFSDNPCYVGFGGVFALGRTAVHEIGHNFGLYHIWGDNTACNDQDFRQLPAGGCTLPNNLLTAMDDTPAQNNSTSGCPTGAVAAGCASSPNPPGKNYQNFMDYTDDPCYSMFTNGQVERMHWVLENCRPGYLTSLGCTPPAGIAALDAMALDVVAPNGIDWVQSTCSTLTYPIAGAGCSGVATFTPRVRIINNGTTTLTSVTVTCAITGGATATQTTTATITLANNAFSTIVFPATMNLGPGLNTITYTVSAPNGGVDAVAGNNVVTTTVTLGAGGGTTNAPVSNDFVTATFPGANWTVFNPNTNNTWVRNAAGLPAASGSLFINNYNFNTPGQIDDYRTITLNTGLTDSIIVEFDYAHKNYPGYSDRLQVLASADCGATFIATSFNLAGAALATAGSSTAAYTTPAVGDWKKVRLALAKATFFPTNQIIIAFRNTNAFGNNIFIDNINISPKFPVDLSTSAILVPTAGAQCGTSFTPIVTVKNVGQDTVKSYRVGYILNGGAPQYSATITTWLPSGASNNVTLPAVTGLAATGHNFRAFCSDVLGGPTGLGIDGLKANDTLNRAFTARALFNAPITENFVSATFAPTNWSVLNPNANVTWVRNANGNGNVGSAFFDNWSNNVVGQIDDLLSPPVSTDSCDEVVVTFDVAHKQYPGYSDSLLIMSSNNCANSFNFTSGKFGPADIASGNQTANYTTPAAADWRTRSVLIPNTIPDGIGSNMIVGFRNKNAFGNNMFLDNINLKVQYKNDIQPLNVISPLMACGTSITPRVRVRNNGSYLTQSFTLSYRIDGGTVSSTNITGLSLARFATTLVNLPTQSTTPGLHTLTVYTSNLISSGSVGGDRDRTNDTMVITFNATTIQNGPVSEGFESTTFTPNTNWTVVNQDAGRTWTRAGLGASGTGSARMSNFNYNPSTAAGKSDFLVTPLVAYTNVDSVYVSFDLAAKTRVYPGSTQLGLDTLEVLVLKDCGTTYTSVWKKWGEDLQTIADPSYSNIDSFVPQGYHWKNVKLNITQAAGTSASSVGVVFKNTANGDNNVYLDNVNLTPLTFPAKLKTQGYLLYPSPFGTSFNIQHFLPPTDLRYFEVFDSKGRLVYRKQFGNGGANATERVNLANEAAGVYTVKLGYTNKQIVERIVKVNN
jgi:hypothetical protein